MSTTTGNRNYFRQIKTQKGSIEYVNYCKSRKPKPISI